MTKQEAEAAGAVFQGSKAGTSTHYMECWCNRCFERFYSPIGKTVQSISNQFERKLPLCAFEGQAICQRGPVDGQPHPDPNPNASGIQLLAKQLEVQAGWSETIPIMKQRGMSMAQVYAAVTTTVAQDPMHHNKTTKNPAALDFVRASARVAVDNFQQPQAEPPPAPVVVPPIAMPAAAVPLPLPTAGGAAEPPAAEPPIAPAAHLPPASGPSAAPSHVHDTEESEVGGAAAGDGGARTALPTAAAPVETLATDTAQQPVDGRIEQCTICLEAFKCDESLVGFPCPGINADGPPHRFHARCIIRWLSPENRQYASDPHASSDVTQAAIVNAESGRGCPICRASITCLIPLGGPPNFPHLCNPVEVDTPQSSSRTSPRTAGQQADMATMKALCGLQSNGVWSATSGMNAMHIGERRPGGRTSLESRLEAASSNGAGISSDAHPHTEEPHQDELPVNVADRDGRQRDIIGGERPPADLTCGVGHFFNPSRIPSPCPSLSSTRSDMVCDTPPSAVVTVHLAEGEPAPALSDAFALGDPDAQEQERMRQEQQSGVIDCEITPPPASDIAQAARAARASKLGAQQTSAASDSSSGSPVHLGSLAAFNGADTGPDTGRMRDDQAAVSPKNLNAALGEVILEPACIQRANHPLSAPTPLPCPCMRRQQTRRQRRPSLMMQLRAGAPRLSHGSRQRRRVALVAPAHAPIWASLSRRWRARTYLRRHGSSQDAKWCTWACILRSLPRSCLSPVSPASTHHARSRG